MTDSAARMSLADAFADVPRPRNSNVCSVRRILVGMMEDDRATLHAMLDDPTVESVRIAAALELIGVEIGPHTIARHRRRMCRCER